jgi:hypothetical protein
VPACSRAERSTKALRAPDLADRPASHRPRGSQAQRALEAWAGGGGGGLSGVERRLAPLCPFGGGCRAAADAFGPPVPEGVEPALRGYAERGAAAAAHVGELERALTPLAAEARGGVAQLAQVWAGPLYARAGEGGRGVEPVPLACTGTRRHPQVQGSAGTSPLLTPRALAPARRLPTPAPPGPPRRCPQRRPPSARCCRRRGAPRRCRRRGARCWRPRRARCSATWQARPAGCAASGTPWRGPAAAAEAGAACAPLSGAAGRRARCCACVPVCKKRSRRAWFGGLGRRLGLTTRYASCGYKAAPMGCGRGIGTCGRGRWQGKLGGKGTSTDRQRCTSCPQTKAGATQKSPKAQSTRIASRPLALRGGGGWTPSPQGWWGPGTRGRKRPRKPPPR